MRNNNNNNNGSLNRPVEYTKCILHTGECVILTHTTKTHLMGWVQNSPIPISVYLPKDRVKKWIQ